MEYNSMMQTPQRIQLSKNLLKYGIKRYDISNLPAAAGFAGV